MWNLTDEVNNWEQRIEAGNLPQDLKAKLQNYLKRMQVLNQTSGGVLREYELITKYIEWVLQIPFGKYTNDNLDIPEVKQTLEQGHYGLQGVKERIVEHLATVKLRLQRQQQNSQNKLMTAGGKRLNIVRAPVLCFIGIQGVGKTTMAKSIANALGRRFRRIALGAFANVRELRGTSRSESGAEPGQIIKSIIDCGTMNPVILLDELDKVSETDGTRADVMAALLEILDPAQNQKFMDRYVDYPIDLSKVLFIATANNIGSLSSALLDRLELIRFTSYNDQEKKVIGQEYILPKVLSDSGLSSQQLEVQDAAWDLIIRPQGMDPGVRGLERTLRDLARKVAMIIVEGHQGKIVITPENFREFIPEEINVYT